MIRCFQHDFLTCQNNCGEIFFLKFFSFNCSLSVTGVMLSRPVLQYLYVLRLTPGGENLNYTYTIATCWCTGLSSGWNSRRLLLEMCTSLLFEEAAWSHCLVCCVWQHRCVLSNTRWAVWACGCLHGYICPTFYFTWLKIENKNTHLK